MGRKFAPFFLSYDIKSLNSRHRSVCASHEALHTPINKPHQCHAWTVANGKKSVSGWLVKARKP